MIDFIFLEMFLKRRDLRRMGKVPFGGDIVINYSDYSDIKMAVTFAFLIFT